MGLESATYISGLNANNPVNATDGVGEGDDHLRLLKSTILNTFPNITGEVTASHTELNQLDGVDISDASELTSGTLADARLSSNVPLLNAASNIFTGDADFDALTATSFGGIAEADLLDKSATETVAGAWTFTGQPTISNSAPRLNFVETGAGADEKRWRLLTSGDIFYIESLTDAGATGDQPVRLLRTGTTIDEIELNATLLDFNGAVDISGALTAATYGGISEANLLDKSAAETVSALWTFTADITVTDTQPQVNLIETGVAADESWWNWYVSGGSAFLTTRTDAGAFGATAISVQRTGTAIDEIQLDATTLDFNGNLDLSGGATIGGNVNLTGTRAIDATTRLNLTGATVSIGESGGNLGFYGSAGSTKSTMTGTLEGDGSDPGETARLLNALITNLGLSGFIIDNVTYNPP